MKDPTTQFGVYLKEAPLKVFAGEEKTVYYIHVGVLLECKSSTANVRINGHWKDTGDGAIDWTHFDRQTVECVLHYLYTGDYYVPGFHPTKGSAIGGVQKSLDQAENNIDEPPSPLSALSTGNALPPTESSLLEEDTTKRPLTPIRNCVKAGFLVENMKTAAGCVAVKDSEHDKRVIGASILMHSKVYSFAHQHFFSDLANFALQRLTQVLALAPDDCALMFPYLADAIRHIYDTTPGPEIQEDPARKLLSQYVAMNYTHLAGEELNALVEEGGDLMIDISKKLVRLLTTKTSEIFCLERKVHSLSAEVGELQTICKDKEQEIQEFQARYGPKDTSLSAMNNSRKKKFGSLY